MQNSFIKERTSDTDLEIEMSVIEANITPMPASMRLYQERVKKLSMLFVGTAVGTGAFGVYVTGSIAIIVPIAVYVYKVMKWHSDKSDDILKIQFSQEFKQFERESKEYAVPLIQSLVVETLQEAQKKGMSDEEIIEMMGELKDYFSNLPEWKLHFEYACEKHPYIQEWLRG